MSLADAIGFSRPTPSSPPSEEKYSYLHSLRDEELSRAMGLALYEAVCPRDPLRVGSIVDRLLYLDRNELLNLLKNQQNLESAITQIVASLPPVNRKKLGSMSLSNLSSPSSNHEIDPGDTSPGGSGGALRGGRINDQNEF